MNEFLGFCAGIICGGKILEKEVQAILQRFRSSEVLMTAAPFGQECSHPVLMKAVDLDDIRHHLRLV